MNIFNMLKTPDYGKMIEAQGKEGTSKCYVEKQKNTKQKTYTKQMMRRNNRKIGG